MALGDRQAAEARLRRKPARADGNELRVRYSARVARELCERIARGETWASMCNVPPMPAAATLYAWRDRYPVFAEALAQARECAIEGRRNAPMPEIFDHLETPHMADDDIDRRPPRKRAPPPAKQADAQGAVVTVRYSKEVTERICEQLAQGAVWASICNRDGLPSYGTLYYWRDRHPEFAEALARAREIAGEARFEAALEAARASTPTTVQSDKLLVGTLLHHAAKLDPVRFGAARERAGSDEPAVRRIVIRRFERARREDGTEYVRVIDSVEDCE